MKKRIVLCADDYGQAPPISEGILTLAKYGRLSATSCLVNTDYWSDHAKLLIPMKSLLVGLHLNLTQGKALSSEYIKEYGENFASLNVVLRRSLLHRLKKEVIAAEFSAQIDRFVEGFGSLPHFIDGHQHVHQFPIIREALIDVYRRRLKKEAVYVRCVNERVSADDFFSNIKKLVILAVGSRAFKKMLTQFNIPHNETFAGIYPFKEAASYREWFLKFLKASKDGTLIMCHPGLLAEDPSDPIAKARYAEFQYFFGNDFLHDCYQHNVCIVAARDSLNQTPREIV